MKEQKDYKTFEEWLNDYISSQKACIYGGHLQVTLALEWVLIMYNKFKNEEKGKIK